MFSTSQRRPGTARKRPTVAFASRLLSLLLLPLIFLSSLPAGASAALTNPHRAFDSPLRLEGPAANPLETGSRRTIFIYRNSGESPNLSHGLYYLRARYMNAANGRFWNADSYEGAEDDPISLHKYIFANDNPISGIDPSGYATLVEIQTSTAIESSWASKVAERVGSLYARSAANRRWLIWRVELKSGVPWFQHTFIWAQDVRTKRAIGYHVLADVKDMVLSRRLRTFVPGLFAVFPQPQVERIGPLRLPVASQIPVGYLSNTQFVVWNALSISTIAAEFMENIYVAGYPYRIPDCNCITWTDAAARNAAVLSAIPF